jgi:hypothetical protein
VSRSPVWQPWPQERLRASAREGSNVGQNWRDHEGTVASPAPPPRSAPSSRDCYGCHVNTLYVIAVMTSLNCKGDTLCLRAIESDSTGHHVQTCSAQNSCIVALRRISKAQHAGSTVRTSGLNFPLRQKMTWLLTAIHTRRRRPLRVSLAPIAGYLAPCLVEADLAGTHQLPQPRLELLLRVASSPPRRKLEIS